MSSILDALNKLEQEKAQSQKDARERNIDAKVAADELLGRRRPQEAASIRLRPAVMVGGGLLALALIVGMSAGISVLVLRGAAPATGTPVSASVRATVEPTPESEPETAALAPGKKPDTTEAPSVAAEAGPSRATVASVVEKRPTPSAAPDSTPSVNAPLTQRSVVAKADTREIATPLATSSPKKAPTRDSSLSGGTSRPSLSESAS